MDDARKAILDKVRTARGWIPTVHLGTKPGLSRANAEVDPVKGFAAAARLVDAEVFEEPEWTGAMARLEALLSGEGVLAWASRHLPPQLPKSTAAFWEAGVPSDRSRITLGLTSCEFAIADTGSLVLVAGPGRNREASLICRTHVALVRPGDIVPDLATAMGRIGDLPAERRAHINIITGPSRTADIEMTLTRGVHGPKRLIIILAPWPAPASENKA